MCRTLRSDKGSMVLENVHFHTRDQGKSTVDERVGAIAHHVQQPVRRSISWRNQISGEEGGTA